jgi:hypothetical protein
MLAPDLKHGFRETIAHAGHDPGTMPSSVVNWARWKYRLLVLDRDLPEAWAEALNQLPLRIRASGPPRPGCAPSPAVVSPALGYVVDHPLGLYSKRRRLDRDRIPKPIAHATSTRKTAWDAPLSTTDMERAVVALVEHRAALTPALACLAPDDGDGRMRLARAFLTLLAGAGHLARWRRHWGGFSGRWGWSGVVGAAPSPPRAPGGSTGGAPGRRWRASWREHAAFMRRHRQPGLSGSSGMW